MPKGGTLIAEGVDDLAEHERRLRLDGYRPERCGRCGGRIHAHQHRSRQLLGEAKVCTEVAIYRCADRERCGAIWRILPALLARHLWRAWSTVERSVLDAAEPKSEGEVAADTVPEQTRRRWRTRLSASVAMILGVLATARDVPELIAVVEHVGYAGTRRELVAIFDEQVPAGEEGPSGTHLSRVAAVIHRLAPGVRLM
ncbi:MAG: hypothetical protein ACREH3_06845 [Geminicoccales bacterium]